MFCLYFLDANLEPIDRATATGAASRCGVDMGNYDNTVKLLHLPTGQCIGTFEGHTAPVVCLAFSPNGQQIVSGSYDRTVKVWNTQTGHLIRTLCRHTKAVYSALFKAIPELGREAATQKQPTLSSNFRDAQDSIRLVGK